MSYQKLLLELSEDRLLFVQKVYIEMHNNALANTRGRESAKAYFLRLVEGNKEL